MVYKTAMLLQAIAVFIVVMSRPISLLFRHFLLRSRNSQFKEFYHFCRMHHHVDKDHRQQSLGWRLLLTMLLNFGITIAELIGGILSGSLALISDALHNFSDGLSIIISYTAWRLGMRPKDVRYTFGWKRAELFAAIINSVTLLGIGLYLIIESVTRFNNPLEIESRLMMIVAAFGLMANLVGTLLLSPASKGNLNIKSAYLHLLTDAASSVAVLGGGILIYLYDITWIDPLLTILISGYLIVEAYKIVRDASRILMMRAPLDFDEEAVKKRLIKEKSVCGIHHIHAWSLTDEQIHFEAHIEILDMTVSQSEELIQHLAHILKVEFDIDHATFQMETADCESSQPDNL